MSPFSDQAQANYSIFRDCLSEPIIHRSVPATCSNGKRKKARVRKPLATMDPVTNTAVEKESNDTEDLAEFIDYIATELFTSLPTDLQTLSYADLQNDPRLADKYADPLPATTLTAILACVPPSVPDSLEAYALLNTTTSSISHFLNPILQSYISNATAPPPPLNASERATACEICHRDWIPLTYHHLIPRATHAKVVKRGWHEEWRLNSVAWLCRACHSFVHRVAGNEELAREWWSVELLVEREDVAAWARWVGRVRWKCR